LPGLGMLMAMALFLPFVFKLEVLQAMPLLVALSAVGFTGGCITSILIGIPGDAANLPTIFDGFPLTKQGKAARALGAALTASLVGGLLSTLYAFGMLFAIIPIVMAITSAEMVFIILMGLAFISMLGKGSRIKALISGGLGLMLSLFGLAGTSGEPRFIFNLPFLYEGFQLVPTTLGLFAMPPLIELAMKGGGGTIADVADCRITIRDALEGARDVFRHKWLVIKSSVIGYFFGVLPGVGASSAVFIAYAHAKSSSKYPEKFGTGMIEGVIAPETCSNAKESGSWLTTLALGVPGSATGAIGLGALIMLGIAPGPRMLSTHLDLSITFIAIVAIANVIAFGICFPLAPQLAKITKVSGRLLVSLGLVMVFAGTYSFRGMIEDVYVLLIFTLAGLGMKHFGFNGGSLLLGFILGSMLEDSLFVSIQAYGPWFFLKPAPVALMAILALFVAWGPLMNLRSARRARRAAS